MVQLKSSSETKEYIMDFGKYPQLLHFYDLEIPSLIIQDISDVFSYTFYNIKQIIGAKAKLTSSNTINYYIIGLLWVNYVNSLPYYYFSLIKFSIRTLSGNIEMDSKKIKDIPTTQYTESISCFEISTYYIICFYKNENNDYTIGAFSYSNLNLENTTKLQNGNTNEKIFFKCVHFYQEIGAFVYYSNTEPPYAQLEFQKYSKNSNAIYRYYNTIISFIDYSFYYNSILNDIIKVDEKKIVFAAVSINRNELYITSVYNYDEEKLVYKIYKINSLIYIGYTFYNTIRL